ncbi:MAG: hypothetical protein IPG96_08075 [Proteobacteria bacterium]|nr:hypothetical protein [Pseudomonadota bacterium]
MCRGSSGLGVAAELGKGDPSALERAATDRLVEAVLTAAARAHAVGDQRSPRAPHRRGGPARACAPTL